MGAEEDWILAVLTLESGKFKPDLTWPTFGVGMGLGLSWVLTLLTLGKGKSELDLDYPCSWNRYRSGAKLGPSHPHLGKSYDIRMQVARKTLVTPSQ